MTYTSLESGGLTLEYYFDKTLSWSGYSLDGQSNVTFPGNATIPMPGNGLHSIQVFGNDSQGNTYQSELTHFTVNLTIDLVSPENITYNNLDNDELPLEYYFDKILSWSGYSLDGQPNITFSGNATIPMPGNGLHSIQVFGNDSQGNLYSSNLRYFRVDSSIQANNETIIDLIAEHGLYFNITLDFPGYLVVAKSISTFPSIPSILNDDTALNYYWIRIFDAGGENDSILTSMTIRFYYDPQEVSDPSDLGVFHFDDINQVWISEQVILNASGNYVEITITELSYFCLAEIYIPLPPGLPPETIIIIIIMLSVVTVSVPYTYTTVSKRKKKKEITRFKSIGKVNTGYKKGPMPEEFKIDEVKRVPEQPVKKKKEVVIKPAFTEEEITQEKKEIEKTKGEMEVDVVIDRCQVHKGPLLGITYVCPKCQTKYCLKCANALMEKGEACWVCEEEIQTNIDSDQGESSINKELVSIGNHKLLRSFEQGETIENVAALSEELLREIEQFEWNEDEKDAFIQEMLGLTPEERQTILDRMRDSDSNSFQG